MSKTVEEVGMIAVGVALAVVTYGAGSSLAVAWGLSLNATSSLFSVGVSAGLAGAFGLLQSVLNPNDTSVPGSQQNSQDSAAFRRVVYGYTEVGGVKTFDSAPAGQAQFQNNGPARNFRHQVYTLTGHEITSFQRNGIYHVVIDGICTALVQDPTGYYVPADELNPWAGNLSNPPGGLPAWHIGFEFDLGNNPPSQGQPFPLLAAACPDWTSTCLQRGCAKVHVAMRYDYYADGSQIANNYQLQTFNPIYVSGSVPSFRFQVTGKPLLDTRLPANSGTPAWQANTPYGFAQYILDSLSRVEVQTNGPAGVFESGSYPGGAPPAFPPAGHFPGEVTPDNQCEWLNAGPVQPGGWPGPGQTIGYPYVFKDPNGNFQLLQFAKGAPNSQWPLGTFVTGPVQPAWATVPGEQTADNGQTGGLPAPTLAIAAIGRELNVTFCGFNAPIPRWLVVGAKVTVACSDTSFDATEVTVETVGRGVGGGFAGLNVFSFAQNGPYVSTETVTGTITGPASPILLPWLCLGTPNGFGFAANPSNPALIVYDYLTNTDYGMAADPARIDLDSINAAANLCEELVVVNIASNGGMVREPLYSCNGVFDHGTARGDVLKALVASCAGTLVPPGDLWHLFAGAYNPPTASLTDADLRDSIKGDFRISRRDLCNGVKGTFMPAFLPTNSTEAQPMAWRFTDFPPYQGNGLLGHPNYIAEDGGQILWKEVRFGFCTSIWQAQRLAKIVLQLLRFQVTLHLACKLTAFQVRAGDTITFTHKRWAALAQPPPTVFFVTQATIVVENKDGAPSIGVDLVLRQTDPSVYTFGAPASPSDQGEYSQYGSLGVL